MTQTPRHTHESEHIQWKKRGIKTDNPAPKGISAQSFIQPEAKCFREPVSQTSQISKHNAANNHIMKVRDQKQAVVNLEINGRYRHHHTRHTTDHES